MHELPDAEILPSDEAISPWYVRATVRDTYGVLRDIATVFAEEGVSFAQIIQKAATRDDCVSLTGEDCVSLVLMTHETTGNAIKTATSRLHENGTLLIPATCFRILASSGNEAEGA